MYQRRRLVVALPDRDRPCELQVGDVLARHLIERAVAVAVARSPPAQPVATAAGGGSASMASVTGVSSCGNSRLAEPRRLPPQALPRLRRALHLGDVGRVADHHARVRGQRALTGHGAVRLQHVGHQINVGLIAERAGQPWRHFVAQVGEQLVGRLSRPTVQEIHARERRGMQHPFQARSVTLCALHAVERPAAGRLLRREGSVRRRGLRRRDPAARGARRGARRDQHGDCKRDGRCCEIRSRPTPFADHDASPLRHAALLRAAVRLPPGRRRHLLRWRLASTTNVGRSGRRRPRGVRHTPIRRRHARLEMLTVR